MMLKCFLVVCYNEPVTANNTRCIPIRNRWYSHKNSIYPSLTFSYQLYETWTMWSDWRCMQQQQQTETESYPALHEVMGNSKSQALSPCEEETTSIDSCIEGIDCYTKILKWEWGIHFRQLQWYHLLTRSLKPLQVCCCRMKCCGHVLCSIIPRAANRLYISTYQCCGSTVDWNVYPVCSRQIISTDNPVPACQLMNVAITNALEKAIISCVNADYWWWMPTFTGGNMKCTSWPHAC